MENCVVSDLRKEFFQSSDDLLDQLRQFVEVCLGKQKKTAAVIGHLGGDPGLIGLPAGVRAEGLKMLGLRNHSAPGFSLGAGDGVQ